MDDRTLRMHAERMVIRNRIALHLVGRNDAGDFFTAQPLVMAPAEELRITEPFAQLHVDVAQQLMDELWNCGMRPRDVGTAGQLGATERHLADMQKLAFHALKVPRG